MITMHSYILSMSETNPFQGVPYYKTSKDQARPFSAQTKEAKKNMNGSSGGGGERTKEQVALNFAPTCKV